MAERGTTRGAPAEGGFAGGASERGRGRGGRGRGEGRGGRRGPKRGGGDDKKEWVPVTKLGRLVKDGKIKSLEEIFLFSIAIKEADIIDYFLKDLKDEVVQLSPVQKQTPSGQRTRFRAFVLVGDNKGHVGVGQKVSGEVANAIRGALIDAKLSIVPVRSGWWGSRFGAPHTVPCKVTGKCGSVTFRVIPAPKGTGLVAAKTSKKLLTAAGYIDCYTESRGKTKSRGNFVKAAFQAVSRTYSYLSPDLWAQVKFTKTPTQEFTDFLRDGKSGRSGKKSDF